MGTTATTKLHWHVGIGTKLLILVFFVGLVPSAVAIAVLYRGAVAAVDEALSLQLSERAETIALSIDQELHQIWREFSEACQVRRPDLPLEQIALHLLPSVDAVAFVTPEGVTTYRTSHAIASRIDLPGLLVSARREFFVDEITSGPFGPALRFFGRLEARGGYLVAWARIERVSRPLAMSLPGEQIQIALVTNRGNVLARTPPPADVVRRVSESDAYAPDALGGWLRIRAAGSSEYLGAYRASAFIRQRQKAGQTTVEWLALAYLDTQNIMPAFRALLWRLGLLGTGVACLLGGLSLLVSSTFLRPLHLLHQGVERIRLGDWETRVEVRTGDEIEDLATAIDAMLADLRRSRAALEQQIEQTRARASQVELVHQVSQAILASFNLERMVTTTESQLSKLLPSRRVLLAISREGTWDQRIGLESQSRQLYPTQQLDLWFGSLATSPSAVHLAQLPDRPGELSSVCLVRLGDSPDYTAMLVIELLAGTTISAPEKEFLEQLSPFLALATRHIELYERVANFAAELEHKVEERANQLAQVHERLLQSERLAVTGQLAAGVAHEINNPLGIVKNLVQLIRLRSRDPSASETLDAIEEELDRIARIVRALLDFARPPTSAGPPANLKRDLDHVLALMETPLRKRHISINVQLESELPLLRLSSDHLRQVLINLLRNAEQAIDRDGVITIRAFRPPGDEANEVVLQVCDNGRGIPPEVLPHIFEPFFTTRRSREGVGLGLSVTYGLVTSVGGRIEVETEPGRGTCFTLHLPVADSSAPEFDS